MFGVCLGQDIQHDRLDILSDRRHLLLNRIRIRFDSVQAVETSYQGDSALARSAQSDIELSLHDDQVMNIRF